MIPVATQEVFKTYWKQGAQVLGLRWVPLFETGIPVQEDDIADVVSELEKLANWARQSEVPDFVVTRIDVLIESLVEVRGSSGVDVFVG